MLLLVHQRTYHAFIFRLEQIFFPYRSERIESLRKPRPIARTCATSSSTHSPKDARSSICFSRRCFAHAVYRSTNLIDRARFEFIRCRNERDERHCLILTNLRNFFPLALWMTHFCYVCSIFARYFLLPLFSSPVRASAALRYK